MSRERPYEKIIAWQKAHAFIIYIARSLCAECTYLIRLSRDLGYVSEDIYQQLDQQLTETSYFLQRLISGLRAS